MPMGNCCIFFSVSHGEGNHHACRDLLLRFKASLCQAPPLYLSSSLWFKAWHAQREWAVAFILYCLYLHTISLFSLGWSMICICTPTAAQQKVLLHLSLSPPAYTEELATQSTSVDDRYCFDHFPISPPTTFFSPLKPTAKEREARAKE